MATDICVARVNTGEHLYSFHVRCDDEGVEVVELRDETANGPLLLLPHDSGQIALLRVGLDKCFLFLREREIKARPTAAMSNEIAGAPADGDNDGANHMKRNKANYARAYQSWSPEEDEELIFQWHQTQDKKVLAQHFGRNPGAISSRLRKLDLST